MKGIGGARGAFAHDRRWVGRCSATGRRMACFWPGGLLTSRTKVRGFGYSWEETILKRSSSYSAQVLLCKGHHARDVSFAAEHRLPQAHVTMACSIEKLELGCNTGLL